LLEGVGWPERGWEKEREGGRETRVKYPIADRKIWEMGMTESLVPGTRREAKMEMEENRKKKKEEKQVVLFRLRLLHSRPSIPRPHPASLYT
jgi:hypothetical protein